MLMGGGGVFGQCKLVTNYWNLKLMFNKEKSGLSLFRREGGNLSSPPKKARYLKIRFLKSSLHCTKTPVKLNLSISFQKQCLALKKGT